jgi:hypothetical protein
MGRISQGYHHKYHKFGQIKLTTRVLNSLSFTGYPWWKPEKMQPCIDTVEKLIGFSPKDLLRRYHFGRQQLEEVERALLGVGLKLKESQSMYCPHCGACMGRVKTHWEV